MASSRWCRAYPRWRGEHVDYREQDFQDAGLPPLARGALDALSAEPIIEGPTPAGAGSTRVQRRAQRQQTAYPRWLGEHAHRGGEATGVRGLPPLARGAPAGGPHQLDALGPTPAGAGSTTARRHPPRRSAAYPRWRGEHWPDRISDSQARGLPPLARGALDHQLAQRRRERPTPAGAGSTGPTFIGAASAAAYPRWRGEHLHGEIEGRMSAGLPPLARGAPAQPPRRRLDPRPTPAGAGSTSARKRCGCRRGAYPRWRGEHRTYVHRRGINSGLPPLARGAHQPEGTHRGGQRPTPAGAGSTRRPGLVRTPCTAYPRWRGEHSNRACSAAMIGGLPPLARGARRRPRRRRPAAGPTPAGAGSTACLGSARPSDAAYPRWRGEHSRLTVRTSWVPGLPPLARGARAALDDAAGTPGPTPAGAGSTRRGQSRPRPRKAYPRWRGEHRSSLPADSGLSGLPPLARGAQPADGAHQLGPGPTPAGAGSTAAAAAHCAPSRAYPRWRGEHANSKLKDEVLPGLPPLARGALSVRRGPQQGHRPTPAGAGSTRSGRTLTAGRRAYPRWRGEHVIPVAVLAAMVGLPPLARGARRRTRRERSVSGPTPAGAGSTRSVWCWRRCRRAYPRWRGEHGFNTSSSRFDSGLPPLARGARLRRRQQHPQGGPTPAGAGSTRWPWRSRRGWRAYPRWRGEHLGYSTQQHHAMGLPPLARGAHAWHTFGGAPPRPTPAGAGSTRCRST